MAPPLTTLGTCDPASSLAKGAYLCMGPGTDHELRECQQLFLSCLLVYMVPTAELACGAVGKWPQGGLLSAASPRATTVSVHAS